MSTPAANDPRWVYRPLIDLIGKAEGTDPVPGNPPTARGYNETLGYGAFTHGPVVLVSMTLDQVDVLQTAMLGHPDNHLNSSAVGRSQIIRTTLRDIRNVLKLSGRALFDPAMQDRLTCFLLGRRGIDEYLLGRMGESTLINNLAEEWASFPTTNGTGHYSGQRARISVSEVRETLAEVHRRHLAELGAPDLPDARSDAPVAETGPFGDVTLDTVLQLAERPAAELDRAARAIALARAAQAGWRIAAPGAALSLTGGQAAAPVSQPEKEDMTMNGNKRWFQSRGVLGGIGAIAALIGPIFGLDLGEANVNEATIAINDLVAAIGALVAVWGRMSATRKITR